MRRSTSLQGCSSASPAFGFDAVPGSLYPPPAAMSSLLCAPGVISILRRHAGLFFVHHGVGSEEWSADGFTRLTG